MILLNLICTFDFDFQPYYNIFNMKIKKFAYHSRDKEVDRALIAHRVEIACLPAGRQLISLQGVRWRCFNSGKCSGSHVKRSFGSLTKIRYFARPSAELSTKYKKALSTISCDRAFLCLAPRVGLLRSNTFVFELRRT